VPIVVLTAYTLSDERRQAFDAGCNECLKKPISKEQILEMVQKYL
jgi:CheY-like chemotaxis protein